MLKSKKLFSLIFLLGFMATNLETKGQDNWEWIPPANDYCNGIKVLQDIKMEEDSNGKLVATLICSCGPGFC